MRPEIITDPSVFQARCESARCSGARVGFVPTMGALHEGHLALAREARRRLWEAVPAGPSLVAVSIFVNPTQFGPREDLSRYPRELDADVSMCESAGVDLVFAPSAEAMYPSGDQTRVRVGALAEPLCGALRPGHFEGVATVVAKLFSLAGPCTAVFGRKDYQQWRVISRMARDLRMPVTVLGHPIVRESDGLALSSRNRYLTPEAREMARVIPRALGDAVRRYDNGERFAEALRQPVEEALRGLSERVDYVSLRDPDELGELPARLGPRGRGLLAVAVYVGAARLIDNVVLGEDPAPA